MCKRSISRKNVSININTVLGVYFVVCVRMPFSHMGYICCEYIFIINRKRKCYLLVQKSWCSWRCCIAIWLWLSTSYRRHYSNKGNEDNRHKNLTHTKRHLYPAHLNAITIYAISHSSNIDPWNECSKWNPCQQCHTILIKCFSARFASILLHLLPKWHERKRK